jgi:transcriptional regulator NrdR family protein
MAIKAEKTCPSCQRGFRTTLNRIEGLELFFCQSCKKNFDAQAAHDHEKLEHGICGDCKAKKEAEQKAEVERKSKIKKISTAVGVVAGG